MTFTMSWYDWDGKDGEGLTKKNDGSASRMKAAGFVNAVSFNLQEVVVLYDPHPIEDEESSNDSASNVFVQTRICLCNKFANFRTCRSFGPCRLSALPPLYGHT